MYSGAGGDTESSPNELVRQHLTYCAIWFYVNYSNASEPPIDNGVTGGTIKSMMPHHRCDIWIPLKYGKSGKPVEPATLMEFLTWFNRQFGGFTPLGLTGGPPGVSQGGFWTDPDTGDSVEDRSFMVMVMVPQGQCDAFRKIANSIGVVLEQKEMLIEIGPPTGEFLKVHDSNEVYPRSEANQEANDQSKDAQAQKGDGTSGLRN
jgi:hypothetical protein